MSCFRAIESINAHVAIATGKPRVAVINSLLGAIVLPASFYVGARNGGIDGVALAWLVTRPFLFVAVTVLTMPVIGLTFGAYLRNLRHPVVASLVMVGTVLAVQATVAREARPLVDLLVCIPVGCVAYFGYHVLFNPGPLREALSALPLQRLRFLRRRIQNAAEVGTGPVGTGGMSL
jgi:O-antigen/teichoic acid export membrane protein